MRRSIWDLSPLILFTLWLFGVLPLIYLNRGPNLPPGESTVTANCANMTQVEWGSVPQWVTAAVALGAAVVAVLSIMVQRQIARKRATIDFFLKSSMDKECLNTYEVFKVELKQFETRDFDFGKYETTDAYKSVRIWLNICELIAVGINRQVFDDRVAFDCWGDLLPWCYSACAPLINWYRGKEGSELSYIDLQAVSDRWREKTIRENYANKAKQRAIQTAHKPLSS
jgi:Domain of unknown function (DUF4760)